MEKEKYETLTNLVSELNDDEVSRLIGICSRRILIIGNWYSKKHIEDAIGLDKVRDMKINETLSEGITMDYLFDTMREFEPDNYLLDYVQAAEQQWIFDNEY